jgi:hypothetical protein
MQTLSLAIKSNSKYPSLVELYKYKEYICKEINPTNKNGIISNENG